MSDFDESNMPQTAEAAVKPADTNLEAMDVDIETSALDGTQSSQVEDNSHSNDAATIRATSPRFGRAYRATAAKDLPPMYGLTDAQFKVLDSKIKDGAGDLLGKNTYGKKLDENDTNLVFLKAMLQDVKNDYLLKLPNYTPPKKLNDLLWQRWLILNHWKKSNSLRDYGKAKKTTKISASVKEILKLENRMYAIHSNIEYNEDTRSRLASDAYSNGPTRDQQKRLLKKGQHMVQDLQEYSKFQEMVMEMEGKLSADDRDRLREERERRE
ncbi:hypothetical protein BU23DRAFT_604836 [Bimuria novae-zelandiae CBS 107.79]|uniref:Uncharacterized protein n=1 Tax=Bimuria novae-zelandiae CBS 107.79 TaxID=1447943 RepID=A0A6A5UGR3_9PLEO|nr:hypothetical protein BU23DRAFT_604836 [Bimuria novae-zelandiae CBS 107.79]